MTFLLEKNFHLVKFDFMLRLPGFYGFEFFLCRSLLKILWRSARPPLRFHYTTFTLYLYSLSLHINLQT